MPRDLTTARSMLFVPATRPGRFRRAMDSGADGIIIDLEDAVAPSHKAEIRREVDIWLSAGEPSVVRINARETPWHEEDLALVARHGCAVMIPKVESASDVEAVQRRLPDGVKLIALLESARAVVHALEICGSSAVARVAFGNFDLGADLGVDPDDYEAFNYARSAITLACAAAGIAPPLDGVTGGIDDEASLLRDIRRARALGFGGKLCIHPAQVESVNTGFSPSEDEVRWATKILDSLNDEGVAVVDGKMIDAPVLIRARRIADASGKPD